MREPTDAADFLFTLPEEQLLQPTLLRNEGRARKSRKPVVVSDIEHPYGGFTHLVVKTALVRSPDFPGKSLIVRHPRDVAELLRHLADYDQEHLVTVSMDAMGMVTAIHEVGIGTGGSVGAQARDVVKVALLTGARAIIVAHNHPSGSPFPSDDDKTFTIAMTNAAHCMNVQLLDSLIVAQQGWYSIEQGGMSGW